MDKNDISEKILIGTALVMVALLVGYNAFYIPGCDSGTVIQTMSDMYQEESQSKDKESEEIKYVNGVPTEQEDSFLDTEKQGEDDSKEDDKRDDGLVNINTASAKEISDNLDRVGTKISESIIDYRQKNGKFSDIYELKRVKGVSDKLFERIKDKITVK